MLPSSGLDVVYTYVDGADAEHARIQSQYSHDPTDLNPERTRDEYTLLRYSVRSLEQFMSWLWDPQDSKRPPARLFIVSMRPQVPPWLKTEHPLVRVVHHDEMFRNAAELPVFSCDAIESELFNIPGLSEHFLYFNDDHLIGRPAEPRDFFTEDRRVRLHGALPRHGRPHNRGSLTNRLFSRFFHGPLVLRKSWFASFADSETLRYNRSRRFRDDDCSVIDFWWRFLVHNEPEFRAQTEVVQLVRHLRSYGFHKLTNNMSTQRRGLRKLQRRKPLSYCLNDDQGAHPDPDVVRLVLEFLNEYYPNASRFERAM